MSVCDILLSCVCCAKQRSHTAAYRVCCVSSAVIGFDALGLDAGLAFCKRLQQPEMMEDRTQPWSWCTSYCPRHYMSCKTSSSRGSVPWCFLLPRWLPASHLPLLCHSCCYQQKTTGAAHHVFVHPHTTTEVRDFVVFQNKSASSQTVCLESTSFHQHSVPKEAACVSRWWRPAWHACRSKP